MFNRVYEYIQKHNMLEPGDGVVVGVSGGADSMALLHLLCRIREYIPVDLYVAHVDHGIRGEAAKKMPSSLRPWQRNGGLIFRRRPPYKGWPRVESVGGAGRTEGQARILEEVRQRVKGHKIALGHHRDDQVETILFNIIRGSGLAGLSGMEPVRDGIIIRPLLEVSRREIEAYCHREGIGYRHDHTNEETIYTRNRVRHMVIPMIEEHFNPSFSASLTRMGDILREDEAFLRDYSRDVFDRVARLKENEVAFGLRDLDQYPDAIRRRLLREGFLQLKKNLVDIHHIHIDGILDLVKNSQVGSTLDLPENIRARKDYEDLILYRDDSAEDLPVSDFEYRLKIPGTTRFPAKHVDYPGRIDRFRGFKWGNECIYIDADRVKSELYVRNRRDGDRFKPLGMRGTKKLRDFFIDRKVPRHKRYSIPLVVDRNNIVWVVGYQMSEDYKVTHKTKRLLKMEIRED